MGLPCLSCKEEVSPDDAQVFAEVFLCPRCFTIAERLYRKGESELRMMLLVLKESIRVAALKGELQFSLERLDDMKKEDLISTLAKLADEAREQAVPRTQKPWNRSTQDTTTSPGTTKPPALPAAGKPSSSSS